MLLRREWVKGDRAVLSTPTERVALRDVDGWCVCEPRTTSAASVLQRLHGFAPWDGVAEVAAPAPAPLALAPQEAVQPQPQPQPVPAARPARRTKAALLELARVAGIFGRTRMSVEQLEEALFAVRALPDAGAAA